MAARAAITSKRHRDSVNHHKIKHQTDSNVINNGVDEQGVVAEGNQILTMAHERIFAPQNCSTPIRVIAETQAANAATNMSLNTASSSSSSQSLSSLQAQDSIQERNLNISPKFRAPILGYEVIEHRDKFTAFKINVERLSTGENWLVFRRYTDFLRLHNKLLVSHPDLKLTLPPKRWLKDNFDPLFLEQRIAALQNFVNAVLNNKTLAQDTNVSDFFCLNDPPSPTDNLQTSRLRCECMETMISNLSLELREKNLENEILKAELALAKAQKETVLKSLRTDNRGVANGVIGGVGESSQHQAAKELVRAQVNYQGDANGNSPFLELKSLPPD